jgi:transcriptional regulator with XRE-family HTH domain
MKNMSIHQQIKAGRVRLGMNEQQFADAVGVSRGAVQQWEKEGGTAPRRKNQPAVAKLMGITVAELMGGDVEPSEDQAAQPATQAPTISGVLPLLVVLFQPLDGAARETVAPLVASLICHPERERQIAAAVEAVCAVSAAPVNGSAGVVTQTERRKFMEPSDWKKIHAAPPAGKQERRKG